MLVQSRQYNEIHATADDDENEAVQVTETTLGIQRGLIGSHPQWWLGAMLLALHYALAWGIDDWTARAVLLAHFGLFLMWQPVWRGERSIESRHASLVVIVGLLLAGWNNWWLMAASSRASGWRRYWPRSICCQCC